MTIQINTDRLASISTLANGPHAENEQHMCAMEAVAYIAGEPWSDHPKCACPIISAFMRSWNDALPNDDERTRLLLPLIPKLVGTRSTPEIETRRATMAADWLIRVHTPDWLRLAKLESQAAVLEGLPEITDFSKCRSLMPTLNAVRKYADAARDAARAAAWDAAGDAAWDAARAAARAAAGDAARAALKPTIERLQLSAVLLVEKMIAAGS